MRPSIISMVAMMLSFAAWLFPSFGVLKKGFRDPEHLDLTSTSILGMWYLLIFVSFYIGQQAGKLVKLSPSEKTRKALDLDSDLAYRAFTFLSLVGIVTVFIKIFHALSIQEAIFRVTLGQANVLNDTLHEDYSIGLVSLRYVVLYSSSLGLYRILGKKNYTAMNIFNVFLLAVGVFLSSRLTLISTLLTTFFLLSFGKRSFRINVPKLAAFVGFIFLLLSALNASRNASYYESEHQTFLQASASEIVQYLGAPFQAEIATAKVMDQLVIGGTEGYRNYTDVIEQLNANSAFVHLGEEMGYFSWVYLALICSFMGFAFELLMWFGKSILLLPCGAILYGASELWRQDLFEKGTFITWTVIGVGVPLGMVVGRATLDFAGPLLRANAVGSGQET